MLTALPDIIQDCSHVALDSVDMMLADPDTAGQAGELPGRAMTTTATGSQCTAASADRARLLRRSSSANIFWI